MFSDKILDGISQQPFERPRPRGFAGRSSLPSYLTTPETACDHLASGLDSGSISTMIFFSDQGQLALEENNEPGRSWLTKYDLPQEVYTAVRERFLEGARFAATGGNADGHIIQYTSSTGQKSLLFCVSETTQRGSEEQGVSWTVTALRKVDQGDLPISGDPSQIEQEALHDELVHARIVALAKHVELALEDAPFLKKSRSYPEVDIEIDSSTGERYLDVTNLGNEELADLTRDFIEASLPHTQCETFWYRYERSAQHGDQVFWGVSVRSKPPFDPSQGTPGDN